MKPVAVALLSLLLLCSCGKKEDKEGGQRPADKDDGQPDVKQSLTAARRGFKTKLIRKKTENEPAPEPPAQLFRTIRYDSPAGKLAAYVSQPPRDGKKHPAIIWVFGGFSNGIGGTAWAPASAKNDQSARAFREAGIVMMYPSLRGGNDNPGVQESFFGEVDDVLAAADYLARLDYVDPNRIYLGGHSTGGTLALLVAASSDRFRAVFSFGPVADIRGYGPDALPFDLSNEREAELRAPVNWLHSILTPVFVFEGEKGNLPALETLSRASRNSLIQFYPVHQADHFSVLAPVTKHIAQKILRDDGAKSNMAFEEKEVNGLFGR